MKTAALAQNFLRDRRTAHKLVHLSGAAQGLLCVDIGAGGGSVSQALLECVDAPVLAIEADARLARQLRGRFAGRGEVEVIHGDALAVALPPRPFTIAANVPFNHSTQIVKRWATAANFVSGALIVERQFASRIAGAYGATKLSVSLAAILDIAVRGRVDSRQFHPQPRADLAIVTLARRKSPDINEAVLPYYWQFVNYIFERTRPTMGDVFKDLGGPALPSELADSPLASLAPSDYAAAFQIYSTAASHSLWGRIYHHDLALPNTRRALIRGASPPPRDPAAFHDRPRGSNLSNA
ncbi:MAG: hypothetical protein IOC63_13060 [Methylobacterium sp.]|jgi:23S rRNA (adenine-N6)-dimethyltransferase|nr:hypothetical protein [Methylobacterium sp.]